MYEAGRFLIRRLGQGALVVWGAFTVSFIVLYLIPGDSVSVLLGGDGGTYVDASEQEALRSSLGLDRPFLVQYLDLLASYLSLDFGQSVRYGAPVAELLAKAIPSTVALTLAAMLLAIVFGIGFAALVTFYPESRIARLFRILPAFGTAIPTFWIALILLQLFSFRWNLFPVAGDDGWRSLVLPAVTIAVPYSSLIAQVTIDGIMRSRGELYVETAVAKGPWPLIVDTVSVRLYRFRERSGACGFVGVRADVADRGVAPASVVAVRPPEHGPVGGGLVRER